VPIYLIILVCTLCVTAIKLRNIPLNNKALA